MHSYEPEKVDAERSWTVLILVVMEDALVHRQLCCEALDYPVLILVVMEDALVPYNIPMDGMYKTGLNPCCNGRCTRTLGRTRTELTV